MKFPALFLFSGTLVFLWTPVQAGGGDNDPDHFFTARNWNYRIGLTAFDVADSVTFGIGFGVKGEYTTAHDIRLKFKSTVVADDDRDNLDSDHIPIWFKNKFSAEKPIWAFCSSLQLDAILDFDHKMNTVSSIEQSATLIPGVKLDWTAKHLELYAKFGAGGYYLEIDDDLPEEYSDYRREDLGNGEFALLQEYKASVALNDVLSFSFRYKDYRDTDLEWLESGMKIEVAYVVDAARRFVLEAEKAHYNLDQFSRSAGDNSLAILPFDEDVFYQAYMELDF